MDTITGLGKLDRQRLTAIIRQTKGTISVGEAADILSVSRTVAAKMLSRWASKGWLSRVRRGLYVQVPLESRTADVPLEEPWLIAQRLYTPCYIGGWSAAEYWGITEQIFRSILVLTAATTRERTPVIKNIQFIVRQVPQRIFFGLKPVWKNTVKIFVSDPSRTIVDMLSSPELGGGIRPVTDMFASYFKSEYRDTKQLIDYALKLNNGAVFKRLGFLLEQYAQTETAAIETCAASLTRGNAKLDPSLAADKLITRWRLWVPENWKKDKPCD